MDPAAVAVAIQELKSVMSAESSPLPCVLLRTDGTTEEVVTDHRDIRKVLGGSPNIVGALLTLNVQAVSVNDEKAPANAHPNLPDSFESGVCGDILLFRTDEESAQPLPFTLQEWQNWLNEGGAARETRAVEEAEAAEGEDEGELLDEEEGEEEDESEDESGEESEEGEEDVEESGDESEEEDWETISEDQMRVVLGQLNLPTDGGRDELQARLREHIKEKEESDDDDDAGSEGALK